MTNFRIERLEIAGHSYGTVVGPGQLACPPALVQELVRTGSLTPTTAPPTNPPKQGE